jgi:CheY-like chemotaxis protein
MGAGQSILIVERKPELITATSDLLECIGYRSERVLTVDDAIEKCANLRPEMILIDASELCKSDTEQLDIILGDDLNAKIVAILNFEEDYLIDKCDWLEGIVGGYLEKPFDIPAASQIISEVMDG